MPMNIFSSDGLFAKPEIVESNTGTGRHSKGPSKNDKSGPATGRHHKAEKTSRIQSGKAKGGDDPEVIRPWYKGG